MAPEPVFETWFLLGSPATPGLRTLRSMDVVDLTAAFLGYALASNFALPLRRFIQPHKGTWRTHFGLLARRYDTQELIDALNRIWLSAVIAVLDAPLTEPIRAVVATDSLAIGSLLPGTVEEAEQAVSAWVEATKKAASQLSSVSPNVSASNETSGADGVVRLLPRAETILRDQVKAILKLR